MLARRTLPTAATTLHLLRDRVDTRTVVTVLVAVAAYSAIRAATALTV